eukprot:5697865-Pyramimonas_sp.AAC.1
MLFRLSDIETALRTRREQSDAHACWLLGSLGERDPAGLSAPFRATCKSARRCMSGGIRPDSA